MEVRVLSPLLPKSLLTPQSRERVRSNGARFVILPGHDIPEAERIVEEHKGYAVVEKIAAAADVAAARNPRS